MERDRMDDGLPRDPAERRAAVAAQFDDMRRRIAALDKPTPKPNGAGGRSPQAVDERPAAKWYRADLERVEGDLLSVIRRELPRVGWQLTVHALLEMAGSVLGDIVEAAPAARADVLQRIGELHLYLAAEGQRAH